MAGSKSLGLRQGVELHCTVDNDLCEVRFNQSFGEVKHLLVVRFDGSVTLNNGFDYLDIAFCKTYMLQNCIGKGFV